MTTETKETLLENLWHRKVPQYLSTYLAVGFGLLQFVEFITKRYDFREYWVDKYLLVWLTLLPTVATLVYFRGQFNPSTSSIPLKWPKYLILGNVVLALSLGGFMFNGTGASQGEMVEFTNEAGEQEKVLVPSLSNRKKISPPFMA